MKDYSRAFDNIPKEFMYATFQKFGFGPEFLQWIHKTKSAVNNCGWVSDFFAAESAIRQGCPFSPLAFVLAIDLLAIKIRDSKDIRGIRHWNVNDVNVDEFVKIALYADDITIFVIDETDL